VKKSVYYCYGFVSINMDSEGPKLPKKIINGYSILDRLGKGQFATVYKARKEENDEEVAIKIVDKYRTNSNQTYKKLFENEIKVLKLMNDPHILKLHEVIDTDANYCVVMQYCEGGTLQSLVEATDDGLDESLALEYLFHIMKGFEALFKKKVIHRDIKPDNIMLHKGKIVFVDFGFAKTAEDHSYNFLGTVSTMAPEILDLNFKKDAKHEYDYKVDLYSIGIVFYYMLFKQYPYSGKTDREVYNNLKKFAGNELHFPQDKISNECKDLLKAMTEIDPANRFCWHKFCYHPIFNQFREQKIIDVICSCKALELMDPSKLSVEDPEDFKVLYLLNSEDLASSEGLSDTSDKQPQQTVILQSGVEQNETDSSVSRFNDNREEYLLDQIYQPAVSPESEFNSKNLIRLPGQIDEPERDISGAGAALSEITNRNQAPPEFNSRVSEDYPEGSYTSRNKQLPLPNQTEDAQRMDLHLQPTEMKKKRDTKSPEYTIYRDLLDFCMLLDQIESDTEEMDFKEQYSKLDERTEYSNMLALKIARFVLAKGIQQLEAKQQFISKDTSNYNTVDEYIKELKDLESELCKKLTTLIGTITDKYGSTKTFRELKHMVSKQQKTMTELGKQVGVFQQSTKKEFDRISLQKISGSLSRLDNMLQLCGGKLWNIIKD
jgi:serine/threonine protein kinase